MGGRRDSCGGSGKEGAKWEQEGGQTIDEPTATPTARSILFL